MGGIWLLAGMWLLGGGPFDGLEDPGAVQQTSTRREQPSTDGIRPVRVEARNQMGKRFRLIDAVFLVDGVQLAHLTAPARGELDISARALEIAMPRGQHALTVVLTYQGRSVGLFSYLDNYRFRTVSTYSFYLERAEGQPVIKILARERPGFFVAIENKPMLEISAPFGFGVTPMAGVNHGTEVTVIK
jgi:hypothetical protein